MKIGLRKAFIGIALLLLAFSLFVYGMDIPFNEQWPLYEGLRSTAAIVFGVMGAWIALLYSQRLAVIYSKDSTKEKRHQALAEIRRFLEPLTLSTMILVVVTVLPLIQKILVQFENIVALKWALWGISFATLGILTVLQLWTLLASLLPGLKLHAESKTYAIKKDIIESKLSSVQPKTEKSSIPK